MENGSDDDTMNTTDFMVTGELNTTKVTAEMVE